LELSTQHSELSFRSIQKLKSKKLVFLVILHADNCLNRRSIIAQVIIRNIEDDLKIRLNVRATQHGWSIEEEVCQILRTAVSEASPMRQRLGSRIAARFAGVGLLEPLPELRDHTITPMDFGA
jgi:antitoxin FitA